MTATHPGCARGLLPVARFAEDPTCQIRAFYGPRRAKGQERPPAYEQRTCRACGWSFWTGERTNSRQCVPCLKLATHRERTCGVCGAGFVGRQSACSTCCMKSRECDGCGRAFRGTAIHCTSCRATERVCGICGSAFQGHGSRCSPCVVAAQPTCSVCGGPNKTSGPRCAGCCWAALPPKEAKARRRRYRNARRARKLAAQVAGPVPLLVYRAVAESGDCVYCSSADDITVDHVIPLARGGWEHELNLVPACSPCNSSKCDRLLHEWDPVRVARAVAANPKVRAAWVGEVARHALAA